VREVAARLDERALVELRSRLSEAGYTTENVEATLGGGRISFAAADVAVHASRLRSDDPFSRLVKLLLLGLPLSTAEAEAAFTRSTMNRLERSGWLERRGGMVRATFKVVPHGDVLVASDPDGDGPTDADWVAGIHPPSVTLAKLTVRRQVERALDVGTGNGVQALLASRHADAVVATDVNTRALAVAALNARLNDVGNVEFRHGSFFEPVDGERFDLVTCNPPYVISPEARYAYRDSGLPGDAVSKQVVQQAPEFLADGGFAHILVSWAHLPGDPWSPIERWVERSGCDSWLLYFGSDDPVTHAGGWLKPVASGEPGLYRESLQRWLAYLERLGIEAIAHGAVILRRRSGRPNWTRKDHVPLDRLEQASEHVLRVFAGQDYLDALEEERALLEGTFGVVDRHHLEQTLVCRDGETALQGTVLSLDEGLGFRIALDVHTARLLPLLDGRRPFGEALARQVAELDLRDEDAERFTAAALPVVRRLIELGFVVSTI
jgi:methylase of polypeptide subunit release factors